MPKYEITIQESGRYSKIIDADNLNDASIKALKELRTYGTGDWMPIYQNSFTILNIDELTIRKE
jgi:uncharacterized protein involved in high-affinity Fe2+ transport